MEQKEFLDSLLPGEGYYCVATITELEPHQIKKDGKTEEVVNYFYKRLDSAVDKANELAKEKNTFFCPARYTKRRRIQENVTHMKSLFVDIDCGEKKPYDSQKEALQSLLKFVKAMGISMPTIVNSGNGIHAYWPLDQELERDYWKRLAFTFRTQCWKKGLYIDNAITIDSARIMRMPGTVNRKKKNTENKPVAILQEAKGVFDVGAFVELVGELETISDNEDPYKDGLFSDGTKALIQSKNDETNLRLSGNFQSNFKKILTKTAKGKGCQQLAYIVTDQENIKEPLWRAGLSIAKYCVDSDVSIHQMSEDHPEYNERATERKVRGIQHPYSCRMFDALNPGGCEGCKNKGKIKNPIQLGRVMREVEREEITYVDDEGDKIDVTLVKEEVPEYPFPYKRGADGGIYQLPMDEDDDPVLIYNNDFYIVRRVVDPELGETVVARLHLPHDKIREFVIPLTAVASVEKLRDEVSKQGISVPDYRRLRSYTISWINELQAKGSAVNAARKFGWVDDNMDRFVIGDRIITKDGVEPNYPTKSTASYFDKFQAKGTLEDWKKAMEFYNNKNMEIDQYYIVRSFASVLMRLIPSIWASGMHLHSEESGQGKSTTLYAAMSVWGQPEHLSPKAVDTVNFIMNRAEVHGDLPFAIDEFSNLDGSICSKFLMDITTGQQKGRLQRSGNVERYRAGHWHMLWMSTGNQSFADPIAKNKKKGLAEAARVLEVYMDRPKKLSKSISDEFLAKLKNCYGVAGPVVVQYIIKNRKMIEEFVIDNRKTFDTMYGLESTDRFWSADFALTLSMNVILNKLGILNFSQRTMQETVRKLISLNRRYTTEIATSAEETLSEYVYDNWNFVVVVDDSGKSKLRDPFSDFKLPDHDARGKVIGRYEKKSRRLWLAKRAFREWCSEGRISYGKVERELMMKSGTTLGKKRLSAGTKLNLPAVACIGIYMDKNFDPDDDNNSEEDVD